ncbi:MAG: hypothetical protein LAT75_03270 [Candidatus Cyclonatronum sp.]|uniref:hypothetical protein n=1 Tax=Cyclonatronum sp. TaxID=3024185 RepID=UPI0025C4340B|nr:hypothetical protein [Cyclonatronum sp.]MCH8485857.1 hypothetical protein [Cyclonatronum sp.]
MAENKTAEALKVGLGKVSVFWEFEDVNFWWELHFAGLRFRLGKFFGRRRIPRNIKFLIPEKIAPFARPDAEYNSLFFMLGFQNDLYN